MGSQEIHRPTSYGNGDTDQQPWCSARDMTGPAYCSKLLLPTAAKCPCPGSKVHLLEGPLEGPTEHSDALTHVDVLDCRRLHGHGRHDDQVCV